MEIRILISREFDGFTFQVDPLSQADLLKLGDCHHREKQFPRIFISSIQTAGLETFWLGFGEHKNDCIAALCKMLTGVMGLHRFTTEFYSPYLEKVVLTWEAV